VGIELTIGLGTLVILVVVAALLLQGRFGRRAERPRTGDPAMRWLHGQTDPTPADRDNPSRDASDDNDGEADGD
jgi:hypothetical protein